MKTQSILVLATVGLFVVAPWGLEPVFAGTIVAWGDNTYGQCDVPPDGDFTAIVTGWGHNIALKSNGSLVGWGLNNYWQASVPPSNDFVQVAAAYNYSLALKTNGSLVAWGLNDRGQCDLPTGNDFAAIAAGEDHALALRTDGSVVGWGYNADGSCEPPPGVEFTSIAAGHAYSLGVASDGSLYGWGNNSYGKSDVPVGNDFVAVAAGESHSLALRSSGAIVAWGDNRYGQCNVPLGTDFIKIAVGEYFSLAVRNDGSIAAWGLNEYGQCDAPLAYDFVGVSGGHRHSIGFTREPSAPPVGDADGPYSIYVGDVLTLDANGSTDPDNDIVSYMWDLDDNNSFETDAGAEAILVVDYAYLESLGLLVNYTYTIHLKVTDSENQSDVSDSTLTIEPIPAVQVAFDIKPGTCPNPVNVKSKGVLPIAILGTEDVNVITIDPTSVRLAGVEPLRCGYEDVATPVSDSNDCNCITEGPDGFLDLTLKFKTQRIVEAVGDVNDGDELQLELIGVLFDETPIEGADCILIRGRHKPINPADINKDGVVNVADFAIFAQNWLQSSIVDE